MSFKHLCKLGHARAYMNKYAKAKSEGKLTSIGTLLGLNAHRQNEMSRHPPLMCVGATEYIEFF